MNHSNPQWDAAVPGVAAFMLDHRRLANGQPAPDFPVDQYKQIDEKFGRTCPEFRVERYPAMGENMVQLVVLDRMNRVRGALALEEDAITMDHPAWLIEQVQRGLPALPRADLKIVG